MEILIQLVINGLLLGGAYAIISLGLTLIFGVVRVVNFAHGEFLMIGMYLVYLIATHLGLHPYVGLVPVAGDLVSGLMGLYIVWEARNLGMSKWQLARMMGHVGFDVVLGAVPVVGDLFDFVYRSNSRNLRIIRKHLDKHHPETRVIEG